MVIKTSLVYDGYDYGSEVDDLADEFYVLLTEALRRHVQAGRRPPVQLPLGALTAVILDILDAGIARGGADRDAALSAQAVIVRNLSRVGTHGAPS